MADLKPCLAKALAIEGIYDNDPEDPGGETYQGVARKMHPTWVGWVIVDRLKKTINFEKLTAPIPELIPHVESFYRAEFWNPIKGDNLPQNVADELFESGINIGVEWAQTALQRALNLLNRNQVSWPDIIEDGDLGPKTMATVSKATVTTKDSQYLVNALNALQVVRYYELVMANRAKEKYWRGWIERSLISKVN